jgi:uncharacterized protein DUF6496
MNYSCRALRGGAVAARVAHNHEVAGSNPAPATKNPKGVSALAKYGSKAQDKVKKTVREYKRGSLKSGSGRKVRSRKQAVAIGLSKARKAGGKVPSKKS